MSIDTTTSGDNRFPQWSIQETREFLVIRADLDRSFMETKRNKLLWEVIANKMKEKGFNRSADQCKCKWKNLVTRYKGCEAMEPEALRQQFPFYNELQAIFTARMQRMLWSEAESGGGGGGGGSSRKKQLSSEDEDDEDNNGGGGDESDGGGRASKRSKKKSKKSSYGVGVGSSNISSNIGGAMVSEVKEMVDEFLRQQGRMEAQWQEACEARERERAAREAEWRSTMQALENERLIMDRRWREREEQWRLREEQRADKRDALVTALLNKLRRDDNM